MIQSYGPYAAVDVDVVQFIKYSMYCKIIDI